MFEPAKSFLTSAKDVIWNPFWKIQYEQYESYHHYVLAKLWNKTLLCDRFTTFHHLIILLQFFGKKHDAVIFRKQLPDVCDCKLLFCTKKQTPIGALRFFFCLHQSKKTSKHVQELQSGDVQRSSGAQLQKAFISSVLTTHMWFENFALLSFTVCFVISTPSIDLCLSHFHP